MAKHKRHGHDRPLKRPTQSVNPLQRILVLCEGKVTEKEYLDGFCEQERNQLVKVEILPEGATPKVLVERAKERKKAADREANRQRDVTLKYNEVWCVFDIDQHPYVDDARQQAKDNGINLAISNPCFELWLLLHFRDHNSHIERHKLPSLLKTHIKEYNKSVEFELFRDGYDDAARRAKQLDDRHSKDGRGGSNPSTGVYKLTEQIREFGLNALFPLQKR